MKRFLQKKLLGELSITDFLQLKYGESPAESQKRFINYLVGDLFNTISEKDILKELPGRIVKYRGDTLGAEEISALKHDAKVFTESVLWEVLSNEVKYLSNLRMYERGKNEEDIIMGKAFLYALETINRKLKELSQLK